MGLGITLNAPTVPAEERKNRLMAETKLIMMVLMTRKGMIRLGY
jgi:hypothetical protein